MWSALSIIFLSTLLLTHAEDSGKPISRELADSTNYFSWELFKEELNEKSGNVVISPVSVSTLLAMLHQGAEAKTLYQLTEVLHATPEQSRQGYSLLTRNLRANESNRTLEFANGAFLQDGYNVRANIQDIMKNDFQSSIEKVDFSKPSTAAAKINYWVAERTHRRIHDLISPDALSADTRFVLTNAIYFKANWEKSFKTDNTRRQAFYTEQNPAGLQVQMMHMNEKFPAGIFDTLDAKWVALPFQRNRFSMLLVVPNQVDGVISLMADMKNQDLSEIIYNITNSYPRSVQLSMPKFKISSTMDLVQPLKRLGLIDIFTSAANLSGISKEPVYVSDVIQKAEIEADEQGATASAATGIFGVLLSAPISRPRPMVITADHPFLAFIVDGLNDIPIFACRIITPSTS